MYINICYCIIKWYHYFVTTEKTWSWERSYDRRKNRSTGGWSRERPRSHGNATPTDWPTQPTRMAGSGSQGNHRYFLSWWTIKSNSRTERMAWLEDELLLYRNPISIVNSPMGSFESHKKRSLYFHPYWIILDIWCKSTFPKVPL